MGRKGGGRQAAGCIDTTGTRRRLGDVGREGQRP